MTEATKENRLSMLYESYRKNVEIHLENKQRQIATKDFEKIAEFPFNDVLVQFDGYCNTISVSLWFDNDILVIVNIDLDETFDGVIFSIYHKKKLFIYSELDLNELVDKLRQ